jgi:hypothetical protein
MFTIKITAKQTRALLSFILALAYALLSVFDLEVRQRANPCVMGGQRGRVKGVEEIPLYLEYTTPATLRIEDLAYSTPTYSPLPQYLLGDFTAQLSYS